MKWKTRMKTMGQWVQCFCNPVLGEKIQIWLLKRPRRGTIRPTCCADSTTVYYILKLKALVFEDRRITINELECQTKFSRWMIGRILHDHNLKMSKVCAKWVSTDFDLGYEGREETMFHPVLGTFSNNCQLLWSPCHGRRNLGLRVRTGNKIPVNGMEAAKGTLPKENKSVLFGS